MSDALRARAQALRLHGLLARWSEVAAQPWLDTLLDWEEQERARRSLERRLKAARIGRFKPLCDFDWAWPERCDRAAIEALMSLDFLDDAGNVVLLGQNGTGKTTLAQNLAHQALVAGHTVLFITAGQLLSDLSAIDSDAILRRRLRHYARPDLLVVDEVGYLSYSNRRDCLTFGGSGSGCKAQVGVVRWRKSLPEAGAEGAVVDSAADLQQKIGATLAPAHLLRLVHPAVHQEVRRPLR